MPIASLILALSLPTTAPPPPVVRAALSLPDPSTTTTAPTETAPTETAPTETAPTETAPTETAPTETAPTEPSPAELQALQGALSADAASAPAALSPSTGLGIAQQAMAMVQSLNPDMALIADVAGAWFSDADNLQRGGHDPKATGFTLQQLEMALSANVDPFFRLDSNIVFSQFGVEVEEAVATTTSLPYNLQVRAGQFLTRIGRQNNTHPHAWNFVDQPLVHGKLFGSENHRGLGVEASWLAPLPWFVEVIVSGTDPTGECCARSYYGGSGLVLETPADVVATAAVKQFFPFGDHLSLLWGLSGQAGPNPTGQGNRTEIIGTDLYLRFRPVDDPGRGSLALTVESFLRRRQVPGGVLQDGGGYVQVVAQWALQFEAGVRSELVTGVDADPLDPTWTGWAHRTSAQATFYPSHFSRLRVQGALTTPPDGRPPIGSVIVALEVLIGAHGAHGF